MKSPVLSRVNGACPYLPSRLWQVRCFYDPDLTAVKYEQALLRGFRRSGFLYYKNFCTNCEECICQRINVNKFELSRSQKRVWRKNSDIKVKLETNVFQIPQLHKLYNAYVTIKHSQLPLNERDFYKFLADNPSYCKLLGFYIADELVAASWVDFLPNSTSSVYAIYSLDFASRSLGVFSALYEIYLTNQLGLNWYYLGFLIKESPAMSYKKNYRPYQILKHGNWQEAI